MMLWLVRHAKPLLEPGICYGALDVPACPQHTQEVAQQLARELPPVLQVVCSPRQRCTLLAQQLQALRPDLRWHSEPHLAEMNFGTWEGRAWADIPAAEMAAWSANFAHHAPGGGESVAAFMARVGQVWDAECARAAGPLAATPRLWITHAGVMRACQLISAGQRQPSQAAQWPAGPLAFGEWLKMPLLGGATSVAATPASG